MKMSNKREEKRFQLRSVLLGLLWVTLVSCGEEGVGPKCSCAPRTTALTIIAPGIQKEKNSSVHIPIVGGDLNLSKAFLSLDKVHFPLQGINVSEDAFRGPLLLDIIASDPLVLGEADISTGEGLMESLQFWINDLDDRNQDGMADADQQPINIPGGSAEPAIVGKSVLFQGSIRIDGESPVLFTFKTDLTERIKIPLTSPIPVKIGEVIQFLLAVDLAEIFNGIDNDPARSAAVELRDAAVASGGLLDSKVTNGGEKVALAIEGAIGRNLRLFYDKNGDGTPEPDELIGDQNRMTITPTSD